MQEPATAGYPIQLAVDYPERGLNRLTSFFRLITVIPIAIVLSMVRELLVVPVLVMLVFRRKYPRWWFDFNRELLRFTNRVAAYFLLLACRYPSTDEEQYVHLDFPYPDAEHDLNRWLPLVKWLLAIPHYIVLLFLYLGVLFAVVIAWFAILLTGRYPRPLFDFVVGVMRWSNRVTGYAFTLVTDAYPPFRLRP